MTIPNPIPTFKNPSSNAYAFGRFFYAAGSSVYYSQVVKGVNDVGRCYQRNDPTSDEIPDLLDTDGGVVPLEGAVQIKNLVAFRSGILAFATNGVWYIYNPDGGFTATSYNVTKITEVGISSPKSVVSADSLLFYFSKEGIQRVQANEFDNLAVDDISQITIRTFYRESDSFSTRGRGSYDEVNKTIHWWTDTEALLLDLRSGGFYPQRQDGEYIITVPVTLADGTFIYPVYKEPTGANPFLYNFALPTNTSFEDFGEPQEAYMVTGYETLGKFANKKSITELYAIFEKTETQITGYVDGEYVYDFPSSCFLQARWDFDNSTAYNKWVGVTPTSSGTGLQMQMYNPMQRGFLPDFYPYTFDTGESVVNKRTTIRGNGKAVQLRFEAEEGKDMKLLGYSVGYSMRARA
jgi:hypothetical protein